MLGICSELARRVDENRCSFRFDRSGGHDRCGADCGAILYCVVPASIILDWILK